MPGYCCTAPLPAEPIGRRNGDPAVLAGSGVAVVLACLLRCSPRGARRGGALAGIAARAVAFVSPLCALSVALSSARAVHHLPIVAIAAPLLAGPDQAQADWGPMRIAYLQ